MLVANRVILCKISSLYIGPEAQGVCLYVNWNTKRLLDPEKNDPEKNVQGQIRFKLTFQQEHQRCIISQSFLSL
jgi:hypothetical protein